MLTFPWELLTAQNVKEELKQKVFFLHIVSDIFLSCFLVRFMSSVFVSCVLFSIVWTLPELLFSEVYVDQFLFPVYYSVLCGLFLSYCLVRFMSSVFVSCVLFSIVWTLPELLFSEVYVIGFCFLCTIQYCVDYCLSF